MKIKALILFALEFLMVHRLIAQNAIHEMKPQFKTASLINTNFPTEKPKLVSESEDSEKLSRPDQKIQDNTQLVGLWQDYWGNQLTVRLDSTFVFLWRFDMESIWSAGSWKIKKDTVFFFHNIVYDTLRYYDVIRKKEIDSLVISSRNEKGKVMTNLNEVDLLPHQNIKRFPILLVLRANRLYLVNSLGKIYKKNLKSNFWHKRFPTWYFKSENKSTQPSNTINLVYLDFTTNSSVLLPSTI